MFISRRAILETRSEYLTIELINGSVMPDDVVLFSSCRPIFLSQRSFPWTSTSLAVCG